MRVLAHHVLVRLIVLSSYGTKGEKNKVPLKRPYQVALPWEKKCRPWPDSQKRQPHMHTGSTTFSLSAPQCRSLEGSCLPFGEGRGAFLPGAKSLFPSSTLKWNSGLWCLTKLHVHSNFLLTSQVYFVPAALQQSQSRDDLKSKWLSEMVIPPSLWQWSIWMESPGVGSQNP